MSFGLLSVVQLSFGEPPWFFLCMFGAMFAQKLGLCRSHIDREDVNEIMLLLTSLTGTSQSIGHFWPGVADSFGALLVGCLVVVAWAVSHKTPIYFMIYCKSWH